MAQKEFDRMAVEKPTKRKIEILAAVRGQKIVEFMAAVMDAAWQDELKSGRVSDAMLQPADEPRYTEPVEAA